MAALRGRCHHCQMKNRTTRAHHTLPELLLSFPTLYPSLYPPLPTASRVWSSLCGPKSQTEAACQPAFLSLGGHQKAFLQLFSLPPRILICLCGFAFSFGLRFCFLRFTFASKQGQFPLSLSPPCGQCKYTWNAIKMCLLSYLPWRKALAL